MIIIRYFFFVLIFHILSISTSVATDLDSLLRLSVGGDKAVERLSKLQSYSITGNLTLNEEHGKFTMIFLMPDKMYLKADMGSYSMVQAYDGEIVWQQNMNGAVSVLSGFESRDFLRQVYMQSFSFLFENRMEGDIEYLGQVDKDGETYHEVAFYQFPEDTLIVYFDMSSGLQRQMFSRLDNLVMTTKLSDYREVEGILFPYVSITTTNLVPDKSEFVISEIEINPHVDTNLFVMPAVNNSDFYFPDNASKVSIPFDLWRGHIYLTVDINEKKKAKFILDSGASANVIDKSLADDLNLPRVGSVSAIGLAGYEMVHLVRTESIEIGQLKLLNQVAGSMEISNMLPSGPDNSKVDGILGYDFLSRFPVMIDYDKSVLTIFNPDRFEIPKGGMSVNFSLTRQIPTVEIEINGNHGNFIIDLGNRFGVILHSKFVSSNKLTRGMRKLDEPAQPLSGVGGSVSGQYFMADEFRIGDLTFSPFRIIISAPGGGLAGSHEIDGNIGYLFLKQFRLLLDYRSGQLVLYPREQRP